MNLYITEFSRLAMDHGMVPVQAPLVTGIFEQSIPIKIEGPTFSEPFKSTTRFILIHADAPCFLAFGDDPNPKLGYHKMGIGDRFYGVQGGKLGVLGA